MATATKKRPAPAANLTPEYLGTLRWLTPIQAMAYLQIGRSSLDALQDEGAIPVSRLRPRTLRFDRIALDKWLSENCAATA